MYYLYILKTENGQYYVGITSNLEKRLSEHKSHVGANFTKRFSIMDHMYTETFLLRQDAESREIQIKGWSRAKKEALIARDYETLKQKAKNSELAEG